MSGKQPDMVDMVRILSALDQIKIRGKYTQVQWPNIHLHRKGAGGLGGGKHLGSCPLNF